MKPEASAVGLDSHRRSLMRDKAETQRRSVESRAAPSFSPLLHRDLFLLTLVSYCAKFPTNTRIISCLHFRQTQGRAVEKRGGQRGYQGGALRKLQLADVRPLHFQSHSIN